MIYTIPLSSSIIESVLALITTKSNSNIKNYVLMPGNADLLSSRINASSSKAIEVYDYDSLLYGNIANSILCPSHFYREGKRIISDRTMIILLNELLADFTHPIHKNENKRYIYRKIVNSMNNFYLEGIRELNESLLSESFFLEAIEHINKVREEKEIKEIIRAEAWRGLLNKDIILRPNIQLFVAKPQYHMPHIEELISKLQISNNKGNFVILKHEASSESPKDRVAFDYLSFDGSNKFQYSKEQINEPILHITSGNFVEQAQDIVKVLKERLSTKKKIAIVTKDDNLASLLADLIQIKLGEEVESNKIHLAELSHILNLVISHSFTPSIDSLTKILDFLDRNSSNILAPDKFLASHYISACNSSQDYTDILLSSIKEGEHLSIVLDILFELSELEAICLNETDFFHMWNKHHASTKMILEKIEETKKIETLALLDKLNDALLSSRPPRNTKKEEAKELYKDFISSAIHEAKIFDKKSQKLSNEKSLCNISILSMAEALNDKSDTIIMCPCDTKNDLDSYITEKTLLNNAAGQARTKIDSVVFARALTYEEIIVSTNTSFESQSFIAFQAFARAKGLNFLEASAPTTLDTKYATTTAVKPIPASKVMEKCRYRPPRSTLPSYFSASSLGRLFCNPYLYYLQDILKILPIRSRAFNDDRIRLGILTHAGIYHSAKFDREEDHYQAFMSEAEREEEFFCIWRNRFDSLAKEMFRVRSDKVCLNEKKISCSLDLFNTGKPIKFEAICDSIEFSDDNTLTIVDYKTGALPSQRSVIEWKYPQLQIEGMLLHTTLKEKSDENFKKYNAIADSIDIKLKYLQLKGHNNKSKELYFDFDKKESENTLKKLLSLYYVEGAPYINSGDCYANEYKHTLRIRK